MNLIKQLACHFEDDDCRGHCTYHGIDETGPAYLVCYECGHRYATKRALRRMFRHEYPMQYTWREFCGGMWSRLTVRVDRITFCPLCAHDW